MKRLVFWIILLCTFQISGCSNTDRPTNHASEQKTNNGGNTLMASEKPSLSIVDVDDHHSILIVSDKDKDRMEFRVPKDAGKVPEIVDSFLANYCGKKVLIIVLRADATTGITSGSTYDNFVLDMASGTIIDVIGAGEIYDRETREVISYSQKKAIAKLKSGIQSADECQKMGKK